MKDLTLNSDKCLIDDLFNKNLFDQIVSRSGDNLPAFNVFDRKKLAIIAERMPEINRATKTLGRKNTQTTGKLMTLTMLADTSPYRVLRQCLSQIENRRNALKENRFKLLKDGVIVEKLQDKLTNGDLDQFSTKLTEIKIQELTCRINDSILYIEGALKEVALYQSVYDQVRHNNNIPIDWDEEDSEKVEVEHHLRMAFLHAYRDILNKGTLGMGTLEYLQQFGVHPHVAKAIVEGYIISCNNALETGKTMDYEDLETFLDKVVDEFKDEYKKVLKRLGLDSLYETPYMYKENSP